MTFVTPLCNMVVMEAKKHVLQKIQENADEIHETEARLSELRGQRDVLMATARREGETWRRIAADAGITEHGARKALISAGLLETHESAR
jgi:hypothetical protein